MKLETLIELHNAYVAGRKRRDDQYQMKAAQYANDFEAAYSTRMKRMAQDGRQFREIILPKIREEAKLRDYENALAIKNSVVVTEPAGA